jgi:hypothetical protein
VGLTERRREQVREFASSHLEEGERIVAVLPNGVTGWPWLPSLNLLLASAFAVVVTDRRVLFVGCSTASGVPESLDASVPRDSVRVLGWRRGAVWGKLVITRPDRSGPFKLNVPRVYGGDGEEVASALRTTAR